MSRVAKKPVALPNGVECKIDGTHVTVKGSKGELRLPPIPDIEVKLEGGEIHLSAPSGDLKFAGTARALLAGMVKGVSEGYTRKLELVGVGYRAAMQGKDLSLSLGFSHPVVFAAPDGVTLATPTQTEITISGADLQRVGETAAKIRALRPPEPYKGKGVRYAGEKIILKEAKKA